ncbi:D-alanyl-D-alanine carboxypeptidase [Ruminococcus sp. M6(2020)]|uniref:serine-type D-Ala-D-Ala carboxypeptidase n=1 Tax=Ruminococcus difficilis TaxID=2763069 RepID=A0A934WUQ4_9FIRM|nr:D-alanyl-D-alanine carboxypeptidase [Ruminococcus difficilis]
MNKRVKFFISVILIFAIFVSSFIIPASSFETTVETSTSDLLLVNLDTDTVVFSQKPDTNWYAGSLAELMTFLLSNEMIPDLNAATFNVDQTFINALPYSDGCLDKFVGQTLTAKDLTAIMLLTSGSDAAYALADLSANNDREAFVAAMNARVTALGMKSTAYVSPGFNNTSAQHTTCRDTYLLYQEVRKNDFFRAVMKNKVYTPAGLDEDYTVTAEASILNENSPYYFRYTNDAMYSFTEDTYEELVATTTYRGKTYLFVGLLGLHQSERNVYADARKLTSWAYLNLSDHKIFNEEDVLSDVTVTADWGDYQVGLHPYNSAFKTLPNSYDEAKLTYQFDIPKTIKTPFLAGQTLGSAKLYYDGEEIENIALSADTDEGLGMLSDFGRFTGYVYRRMTPHREVLAKEFPTEPAVPAVPSSETPAASNAGTAMEE